MSETPDLYSFYRPILWDNGEDCDDYRYSTGATANIVKLCGEFFILTVNHAMDKASEGWTVNDCRIPWRIGSEAYCNIGKGVNFTLPADHECKLIADVCIHKLAGPSYPESELKSGEYLELDSFAETSGAYPRYLSGFPRYAQDPDYEARELKGTGLTLPGIVEDTADRGIYKFISEDLKGIEANGYCGGLITCDVFGNVSLEGMCIQGGNNKEIDFIYFIGVDVLQQQLSDAFRVLINSGK